jgi:hypothetical protein
VKRETSAERKSAFAARTAAVARMHRDMKARDREAAALGWDSSPVSTSRLAQSMGVWAEGRSATRPGWARRCSARRRW